MDGEPQDQASDKFRFSLLHRAVRFHLPDDRMLVAGQPEALPEGGMLEGSSRKAKGKGHPFRLPRGRLHPPSLAEMMGSVVKFRKKKNWAASEY